MSARRVPAPAARPRVAKVSGHAGRPAHATPAAPSLAPLYRPERKHKPRRRCLGCGTRIASAGGTWLCPRCRSRRRTASAGVPESWLPILGSE